MVKSKLVIKPVKEKSYNAKIKFVTPYLQHRMDDTTLEEREKNGGLRKITERKEASDPDYVRAAFYCHRNEKMECFFPESHLKRAMVAASTNYKSHVGNGRKSMKDFVSGMFSINPYQIPIREFDEISKMSAVNNNNKARIIVIRPQWNNLELEFNITVADDSIIDQMVLDILQDAGRYVGCGSYRPTKQGPFGKFEVIAFTRS